MDRMAEFCVGVLCYDCRYLRKASVVWHSCNTVLHYRGIAPSNTSETIVVLLDADALLLFVLLVILCVAARLGCDSQCGCMAQWVS